MKLSFLTYLISDEKTKPKATDKTPEKPIGGSGFQISGKGTVFLNMCDNYFVWKIKSSLKEVLQAIVAYSKGKKYKLCF